MAEKPDNVEVFDKARKRTILVDLDAPFFEKRQATYPDCNHRARGVILDVDTRKVECKCGVEIDAFDALLLYANAERRLQSTREAIEEHNRKEAEKKAKKPFVRRVTALAARYNEQREVVGYDVRLECGHTLSLYGRRHVRNATCQECYRNHQREQRGVAVLKASR